MRTEGTSPQQEQRARQRPRITIWPLVSWLAWSCGHPSGDARVVGADTPALLRVISRAQADYTPRPVSAAERQRRSERERAATRLRLAEQAARRVSVPAATVDSVAGQIAPAEPAAGPMQTIRIAPDAVTLRVGETASLTLEGLDSAGRRAHVPAARWRPDDTEIVSLDRSGLVTATAPGVATIEAWVDSVRTTARVEVLPVVRGRVVTIDGDAVAGAQVRFTARGFADSLIVPVDGRFEFRPPATFSDTAELSIRAADERSGQFHPLIARLTARATGPELNAVMVPTAWTIRSGTYAGTTVDVSADVALRRWRGVAPFARAAQHTRRQTRRVVGWPTEALPLPVVFLRDRPALNVSAADSVAFWNAVRRFEDHLGISAFQPAEAGALSGGRLGVEVMIDPTTPPDAVTWASWTSSGDLNDARVAVRKAADFRNTALVAHEMLHALGFGHAVEWRSVMTRTSSPSVTALTAQDVAYVQLIYRIRAAQSMYGAEIGFLEAAEGERRARR